MNVSIDTMPELITAGLIVLGAVGLLVYGLVTIARRGRAKVGALEVGGPPDCAPYAADHAAALARLEVGLGEVKALLEAAVVRINQNDLATGALVASQKIVAKWIRRELGRQRDERDDINGDLDEADEEIDRAAESYRQGRRVG